MEEIAREKLAVAQDANTIVVLPDDTFVDLVPAGRIVKGGAREAAEAFVGHPIEAQPVISLPGRLERRDGEIRDGAHNSDGVRWLADRLSPADYTICASILADKDADAMLAGLGAIGTRFVATRSTNPRALDAAELARLAMPHFELVEAVDDPVDALARAHDLGEPVLVTGSLYLLADLAERESR